MLSKSNEIHQLLSELQKCMGRNLMLFGAIEQGFKLLIPNLSLSETGNAVGSKEKINKLPLGELKKLYLKCIKIEHDSLETQQILAEYFEQEVQKVIDSRNILVHGFFLIPEVDSYTKNGLNHGLKWLDDQFHEAENFYKDYLAPIIYSYLNLISANDSKVAEDLSFYIKLLSDYVGEAVNFQDRDYTEIARLFKLAEQECKHKVEEMTPLAFAGNLIKTQIDDFKPSLFGKKKLRDILEATSEFDIFESIDEAGIVQGIFYKSKEISTRAEYFVFPVDCGNDQAS